LYRTTSQTRTAKTDRPSKRFESNFSEQFRSYGLPIERILDLGYNQVVCDYYAVIPEGNSLGLPGMACFFELITTEDAELPLAAVEPDILEELARYDETLPEIHAGFILNFKSEAGRRIVYISGRNLKQYVVSNPEAVTLPASFLERYGLPIPMLKKTPKARKCLKMDIPTFLRDIHEADRTKLASAA